MKKTIKVLLPIFLIVLLIACLLSGCVKKVNDAKDAMIQYCKDVYTIDVPSDCVEYVKYRLDERYEFIVKYDSQKFEKTFYVEKVGSHFYKVTDAQSGDSGNVYADESQSYLVIDNTANNSVS